MPGLAEFLGNLMLKMGNTEAEAAPEATPAPAPEATPTPTPPAPAPPPDAAPIPAPTSYAEFFAGLQAWAAQNAPGTNPVPAPDAAPIPAPPPGVPVDSTRQTPTEGMPVFRDGTPVDISDKANWQRLQAEGLTDKYAAEMRTEFRRQADAAGGELAFIASKLPGV